MTEALALNIRARANAAKPMLAAKAAAGAAQRAAQS